MPEIAPETHPHVATCPDCQHAYLLHRGGCGTARGIAQLRDALTDAQFVLAMLVKAVEAKALEDSGEVDLEDSGEYETKLVREAKRVLEE